MKIGQCVQQRKHKHAWFLCSSVYMRSTTEMSLSCMEDIFEWLEIAFLQTLLISVFNQRTRIFACWKKCRSLHSDVKSTFMKPKVHCVQDYVTTCPLRSNFYSLKQTCILALVILYFVFGIVYNLFVSDHSCYLKYFKASFAENYVSSAFPSKFQIELRILLFQEMSNTDCIISLETDFPIFSSYIRNIKRLGSFWAVYSLLIFISTMTVFCKIYLYN